MRRAFVTLLLTLAAPMTILPAQVTRYVRYSAAGATSYGLLDGQTVRELNGDLFSAPRPTGRTHRLDRAVCRVDHALAVDIEAVFVDP